MCNRVRGFRRMVQKGASLLVHLGRARGRIQQKIHQMPHIVWRWTREAQNMDWHCTNIADIRLACSLAFMWSESTVEPRDTMAAFFFFTLTHYNVQYLKTSLFGVLYEVQKDLQDVYAGIGILKILYILRFSVILHQTHRGQL
jgi:hypothetical protein